MTNELKILYPIISKKTIRLLRGENLKTLKNLSFQELKNKGVSDPQIRKIQALVNISEKMNEKKFQIGEKFLS